MKLENWIILYNIFLKNLLSFKISYGPLLMADLKQGDLRQPT